MLTSELIERITREVLAELNQKSPEKGCVCKGARLVPVAVSARHVHLARAELETLFGSGYELTRKKDLYQPGEFAAEETVTLVGPNLRPIANVRILGPIRSYTQVEISRTDAILLGVPASVTLSGRLAGTAPIAMVGPAGSVTLKEGAIIANRHIHMSLEDAARWGLQDNEEVTVQTVQAERPTVYKGVQIRLDPNFKMIMHIDTDDANAAGLRCGDEVEIIDG